MANHLSAKKRIRQTIKRRDRNRYFKKSTRTAIANLREMTDHKEASEFMPKVVSMIDRLAKTNVWHKNKAANLKRKLNKHVKSLQAQ
jgi:small subunit ribosomal protein S20